MNIIVLHDAISASSSVDEADVLTQAQTVEEALRSFGHVTKRMEFALDLARSADELRRHSPDIVFNLVESVGGQGRLIHLAPVLLESLRIPYAGCPADAIYTSSNKLLAKNILRGAGIDTPPWVTLDGGHGFAPGKFILKSVWEHASRGIDDSSVIDIANEADARRAIRERAEQLAGEGFAEAYIEGREFNLSFLGGVNGVRALPPAEIDFVGYAPGKPRIVGYAAKWAEGSFEYGNTPRRFEFPASDETLLRRLIEMGHACWRAFGLHGWARVDFRVDNHGRAWVLEVNANPCLSPDAGFAAAVQRAGLTMTDAVRLILESVTAETQRHGEQRVHLRGTEDTEKKKSGVAHSGSLFAPPRLRGDAQPSDHNAVREIVSATGFFSAAEVDIAVELIDDKLAKGAKSDYRFIFAELDGRTVGYACFGEIACTVGSYDLYWIAVHPSASGRGVGKLLNHAVEQAIRELGGRRVYAETSGRAQYEPTRAFYRACGYIEEARFPDFYAPGDDKVVFGKELGKGVMPSGRQ